MKCFILNFFLCSVPYSFDLVQVTPTWRWRHWLLIVYLPVCNSFMTFWRWPLILIFCEQWPDQSLTCLTGRHAHCPCYKWVVVCCYSPSVVLFISSSQNNLLPTWLDLCNCENCLTVFLVCYVWKVLHAGNVWQCVLACSNLFHVQTWRNWYMIVLYHHLWAFLFTSLTSNTHGMNRLVKMKSR